MSAHLLRLVDALIAPFIKTPVTGRMASEDFGPTLITRYPTLAAYSDAELIRLNRDDILAEIRECRTTEHEHVAGWGGVPGECGVECACGVTFDGFDTLASAAEFLDHHIASALLARTPERVR